MRNKDSLQSIRRKAIPNRLLSAAWWCLLLVLTAIFLGAGPSYADKRVALVVGNGAYVGQSALKNPANDARDMSAALETLGFQVFLGVDVDKRGFDEKLHEFTRQAANADVALFYYSGHGMQVNGVNYLIPTDAPVTKEDLDFQTVTLDFVQKQISSAKTKIVVLDACRNNPFAKELARSMGTRAVNENLGLALTTAPDLGSFVAFATQPGHVASDGEGQNSPFTGALKAHIETPGLSLSDLMIVVRNEVVQVTNSAQVPWDHSALATRFYFKEGTTTEPDATKVKASEAAEVWSWVRDTANPQMLRLFIAHYGDTSFGANAKARLAEIAPAKPKPAPAAATFAGTGPFSIAKPSYDCKVQFQDSEVTICNSPELSLLDNEMDRLYTQSIKAASEVRRNVLSEEQRQWLKARNACSTDTACLSKQYTARIEKLKSSAGRSSRLSATQFQTSFDCKTRNHPAEAAVCGDADLAQLDRDLDRLYTKEVRRIANAQREALVSDQRQWVRDKNTCSADVACLKVQYEARIQQLKR
jgi:uncharacterized protein